MLSGRDAFIINGCFGASEKTLSINFSKAKTRFCFRLYYNDDNSYLFVNKKEIYNFKADNKNVNFPNQFYLGSTSNKFDFSESSEVYLKGNVYDYSVVYDAIDKSDILNIHKYFMVKNNLK